MYLFDIEEGNNFDSIPSELRRLLPENGGELESYEPSECINYFL